VSFEAVGRRYAQAIFEIAKEEGNIAPIAEQIADFAHAYRDNVELRDALDNPLVPEEARLQILLDVAARLAAGETVKRALRVVFGARRLRALPDIASHLARLVDLDQKVLRATVTSAKPLDDGYLSRLKAQLEQATGAKVVITASVDESLLAGVVTQIGDRVVDGSLKSRLAGFARAAQSDRLN
jgi:F-type H+-transporting ATPase subunit delta